MGELNIGPEQWVNLLGLFEKYGLRDAEAGWELARISEAMLEAEKNGVFKPVRTEYGKLDLHKSIARINTILRNGSFKNARHRELFREYFSDFWLINRYSVSTDDLNRNRKDIFEGNYGALKNQYRELINKELSRLKRQEINSRGLDDILGNVFAVSDAALSGYGLYEVLRKAGIVDKRARIAAVLVGAGIYIYNWVKPSSKLNSMQGHLNPVLPGSMFEGGYVHVHKPGKVLLECGPKYEMSLSAPGDVLKKKEKQNAPAMKKQSEEQRGRDKTSARKMPRHESNTGSASAKAAPPNVNFTFYNTFHNTNDIRVGGGDQIVQALESGQGRLVEAVRRVVQDGVRKAVEVDFLTS